MQDHPVVIPTYAELMWPTLQSVIALGGSGRNDEITNAVMEQCDFTDAQQAVLHGDGPGTEIAYRLTWARSYLKAIGALANSVRGVWAVTEEGRTVDEAGVRRLNADYRSQRQRERAPKRRRAGADSPADGAAGDEEAQADAWEDRLLERMIAMPPAAFERLAQRLLREAGFISATVTGRTGDGGIDGLGVYRLSLLSFPVFFQCKRYRGSVGAGAVRDFRGAMAGRGDKGLLVTTGTLTTDAMAEATRDGAPPIDLIDGARLCDLLKTYGLGVRVTARTIEDLTLDEAFFADV